MCKACFSPYGNEILYFSFICTIIHFLEPASGVIPNGDSLPLLIIGVTVAILTLL